MRLLRLGAGLLLGFLCGCQNSAGDAPARDAAPAGDQSKSVSPEEVGQGMQLCRGYVQRVCACAEKHGEFAEECALAKARPQGLAMTVKFLAGSEGPISTRERLEAEASVRKVVAACVKADAALDPKSCPR